MNQTPVERIFTVLAQGNPGCAQFLCELAKHTQDEFWDYTKILARNRLTGSRAYMLWNDANNRDIVATAQLLRDIGSGRLSMEVVEAHLAEVWCRPFTPDEYAHQPAQPKRWCE